MSQALRAEIRDSSLPAKTSAGVASLSEAKPLRWSFLLTISIVVLSIWAVVLILAQIERRQLVAELTDCVEHGDEEQAVAALVTLTHLPSPPLETLASAAVSPTRVVACQAQESITDLLRIWRAQLAAQHRPHRIAAHLDRLVAALDAQRDSFPASDYLWLTRTTERILRLANAAPPQEALGLALHCDSLLTTAGSRRFGANRHILTLASSALDSAPPSIFTAPSRLALQSIVPDEPMNAPPTVEPQSPPPAPSADQPGAELKGQRRAADRSEPPSPRPLGRQHHADLQSAAPIAVAAPSPAVEDRLDPWNAIDSHALLLRWLESVGTQKDQIERELERRGFGRLRADVVRLALSNDTEARVQLVEDLPTLPAVGAKAWLLLLADDAAADVRLAAVTVMITSNDTELLEKAWQVALHDRDPRIAALVERMRDRRAATFDGASVR